MKTKDTARKSKEGRETLSKIDIESCKEYLANKGDTQFHTLEEVEKELGI